jgi:hypothetical protein
VVGFADVEAAQLIVQHTAEADANFRASSWDGSGDRERRRLIRLVELDRRCLCGRPCANRHLVESNIYGVQHDARGRFRRLDADRFDPVESLALEVDDKCQIVMVGSDTARQLLGRCRE